MSRLTLSRGSVRALAFAAGFVHAAYTLRQEVDVDSHELDPDSIGPGSLVHLLHRGLQYLELEANAAASNDAADGKFEVLHAADILQAQDIDKLKALVKERMHDSSTSQGPPKPQPPVKCEDSGLTLPAGASVYAARWNPAGDMLAAYCLKDGHGVAQVWKVGSTYASTEGRGQGECMPLGDAGVTTAVVWRPDGRQLAVGKVQGQVQLWSFDGEPADARGLPAPLPCNAD